MSLAADAKWMLLDASVICRFTDAKHERALVAFLGQRARITVAVWKELKGHTSGRVRKNKRRSEQVKNPHLIKALLSEEWPLLYLEPPEPFQTEIRALQLANRGNDVADQYVNLGEITTVIAAKCFDAPLVVIDDELGVKLARQRDVARISTAQLVCQMQINDAISMRHAAEVFAMASGKDSSRVFRQALKQERDRMGY